MCQTQPLIKSSLMQIDEPIVRVWWRHVDCKIVVYIVSSRAIIHVVLQWFHCLQYLRWKHCLQQRPHNLSVLMLYQTINDLVGLIHRRPLWVSDNLHLHGLPSTLITSCHTSRVSTSSSLTMMDIIHTPPSRDYPYTHQQKIPLLSYELQQSATISNSGRIENGWCQPSGVLIGVRGRGEKEWRQLFDTHHEIVPLIIPPNQLVAKQAASQHKRNTNTAPKP